MLKRFILIIGCLICMFQVVTGQVTTSGLSGRVISEGEALAGATVLAVHQPTGTCYGTITNLEGQYFLQGLYTGGPYKVEVSYVGCQPVCYTDLRLVLGETYVLNVSLEESTELSEVVVTASRRPFASTKTGASNHINSRQIAQAPNIGQTLDGLVKYSAYANGGTYAFGGRDQRQNSFTVDGASFNNNMGLGNFLLGSKPISTEALEEVQINIAPFDVRQSNFVGGSINAVTKSGTNQFKGSGYTYIRNEKLRGNTVDGFDLGERAEEAAYIYGVTLGGPIIKNKLFFFINGEMDNSPKPMTKYTYSTDGVRDDANLISRVTEADMAAFSSVLKNRYGYNTGSWTDFSGGEKAYRALVRLDWNINQAHKLMFRYNYTQNSVYNPVYSNGRGGEVAMNGARIGAYSMSFRNSCYTVDNNLFSLTAELNSTLGRNKYNKFSISYTSVENNRRKAIDGGPFPTIDIMKPIEGGSLYTFMNAGYDQYAWNNGVLDKTLSISDNFSYNLRRHSLTAGLSFDLINVSNSYMRSGLGYYRYNSYEDFVNEAAPSVYTLTYSLTGGDSPTAEVKMGQFAAYLQDEHNVSDRLKLIYGLRIDLPIYLSDKLLNPAVAGLDFDGRRLYADAWPATQVLFSPRVGFNWDILGDQSLKLRGGTGIFTGRMPLVFLTNIQSNSGMIQNTVTYTEKDNQAALDKLAGGIRSASEVIQLLDLPTEPGTVNSLATLDKDFKLPQVWKTSVAADYRLPLPFDANFTFEGIFIKDINAIVQSNYNVISLDNEKMQRFNGPDTRYFYPGGADNKVLAKNSDALLMSNTSKGYSYTLNTSLQASPVRNLDLLVSYTYTGSKSLFYNQGNDPISSWKNQMSVDGPNNLFLQNPSFLASPSRVVASVNYTIPYARKHMATSVALVYTGERTGSYTYCYTGDMNNDGVSNDLLYIPRTKDELTFTDKKDKDKVIFTAAEQADAFWNFVNQDPYLSKHKGEYAEAFSAFNPWAHRFDLRILQNFSVQAGKQNNTLQISLDILNVGNLLNNSWGLYKSAAKSGGGRILERKGVTADNVPLYNMTHYVEDGQLLLPTQTFSAVQSSSNCWQMQIGIRYMFN